MVTSRVALDDRFLIPSEHGPYYLQAFVETGNTDPAIFATLVCDKRTQRGKDGVMISVFFPNNSFGKQSTVTVTLFQPGALRYKAPVKVKN
jgi:hypothetical protein